MIVKSSNTEYTERNVPTEATESPFSQPKEKRTVFSVFSCFSSVVSVLEFLAPCVGTHNQLFESRAFSEQVTGRSVSTRRTLLLDPGAQ